MNEEIEDIFKILRVGSNIDIENIDDKADYYLFSYRKLFQTLMTSSLLPTYYLPITTMKLVYLVCLTTYF
jgi:hypothetical protein